MSCRKSKDPREADEARRAALLSRLSERYTRQILVRARGLGMSPSRFRVIAQQLLRGEPVRFDDVPNEDDARFLAEHLQRYVDSRDHGSVRKMRFRLRDGTFRWWSFVGKDFVGEDFPEGGLVVQESGIASTGDDPSIEVSACT